MPSLASLAADFAANERPAGNVIDQSTVLAQAVAATRFVAGYKLLAAHAGVSPMPDVSGDTEVSVSEWALIRPLFLLYVEREQALHLEATRGMGLDPFGRASSEVAGDIAQIEQELPHRAFSQAIITV